MKIIGQIYEEENYDVFHKLNDNRDLLSTRLNKLIASISERYVLNPISVNEKMEIIDGQGRYEACKKLGRPIHYYIAAGATSADCRRMNKYNTKWTALDFAKSYAQAGVKAYQYLLVTCKRTGFGISRAMRLANHGGSNTGQHGVEMNVFESGRMIFHEADIAIVENIKSLADEIADALQYTGRRNDAFYVGVKIMSETEKYDHHRMIECCKKNRATYTQMSRIKDQLVEFERIYNYKLTSKNKLYFSDYMRNRGSSVRDYSKNLNEYSDIDVSTLITEDDAYDV